MNIVFIKQLFVGFIVSEIDSKSVRIRAMSVFGN